MKMRLIILVVSLLISGSLAYRNYQDPHFAENRKVIVHLFEWKWSEIAKECEKFLGPYGFGGVQISPVTENAVITNRPWWERYQPVSYKFQTRSGSKTELRNMIERCNKAKIRVYVDIVSNHMTGGSSGSGTAGSSYNGNSMQYPGVPYGPNDFNGYPKCPERDLEVHDYENPNEARNCRLSGLRDLNQGSEYVRQKQISLLNNLINMGVAGFRIDAAKHQWPADLKNITLRLNSLKSDVFGSNKKPFFYHEVVESFGHSNIKPEEYFDIGRTVEFRYAARLALIFRRRQGLLKDLKTFGKGWDNMPAGDNVLVMIDNHDMQRGHTGDINLNICFFDDKLLKMSTAFMLAWPFAVTRVMSSYRWNRQIQDGKDIHDSEGPPHDGNNNILDVERRSDLTCGNGWVCEHRWRQIYQMASFRNVVGDVAVENWWDNGYHQIAFSRGDKGFIAINNDDGNLNARLSVGVPPGRYCDIISGNLKNGNCTGSIITVDNNRKANIYIESKAADGIIAFHIGSKLD